MTPDHIIYRSEYHPHPPIQVIEFLKYELQIGKKYVVLLNGESVEHFGKLLIKHIHLLCISETDQFYLKFIREQIGESSELWTNDSEISSLKLYDDSLDAVLLMGSALFSALDDEIKIKELERCLRLNSYVLGLFHRLDAQQERTFSWAFAQFFKQYSNGVEHEYLHGPQDNQLKTFYKSGYEMRFFANQVRLDWDGLQGYFLASRYCLEESDPRYKWALKALRILFDQYAVDGVVILDYKTELYFGLFNKNVPAISLRKNIFFTLLRPFAFGFYVLVKLNIYFWKMIEGLFSRR